VYPSKRLATLTGVYVWTKPAQMFCDLFVRTVFGAEPRELSFLYFLFYINSAGGSMNLLEVKKGAQQEKFVGGSNLLCMRLAEQIEAKGNRILLGHDVIDIEQNGDKGNIVKISNGKKFYSKYPLSILNKGNQKDI
jgi:monoamine oxidase